MSIISSVKSAVYSSKTLNIVDSYCKDRNSFGMKSGVFTLNGKEIVVKKGETLESLSLKINKHSNANGIKAKIVEKDNGYKLQLISKNKTVQISDPKGVLKKLYDEKHIGNSSKHLVQVIGGELYYNKALPSQSSIKPLLKSNKQYAQEPNLFVENTLVNLNEKYDDENIDFKTCYDENSVYQSYGDLKVDEDEVSVINDRCSLESDASFSDVNQQPQPQQQNNELVSLEKVQLFLANPLKRNMFPKWNGGAQNENYKQHPVANVNNPNQKIGYIANIANDFQRRMIGLNSV